MADTDNGFVKISHEHAGAEGGIPSQLPRAQDVPQSPTPAAYPTSASATPSAQPTSKIAPALSKDTAANARQLLQAASERWSEGASMVSAFCLPESMRQDSGDHGDATQADGEAAKQAQGDSGKGEPVQPTRKQWTPQQKIMQDKIAFFLGVVNLVLTAFWLGKSPGTWYRWFTVKAIILFSVRYHIYRAKHFHYYMLEFCYFANVLLLVQLWVLPSWPSFYKATFSQIAGPMTAAIPALGNSLVLHSLDKTTSLFMHISPALMAWALRWYPSPEDTSRRNADPQSWEKASFWDLVTLPMLLYSLWATFYYLKIFVISSKKVTENNYSTLFTLMTSKKGSLPNKIVLQAPKSLQPLVYMGMHLLMVLVATFTSLLWWHSFWAHTIFVCACAGSSAWMGATYQFDVFVHRYLHGLGLEPQIKKQKAS